MGTGEDALGIPALALDPIACRNGGRWVPKSPVDSFIQHRLRAAQLRPADPASARTLVRRLYFDVIGLPPTPQQARDFEKSYARDPDSAVRRLVDGLLTSPHYGERWARHWLDVARYADSDGQESDRDRRFAFHYRDFVVRAFNEDMPYDRFVRWQIAGDEYAPHDSQAVAATGFLTAGPSFKLKDSFLERERLFNRYNELDDIVSTLGSSLLGITVGCARCHDHKYDAFTSREYYQLLRVFHSGDRVTAKLPSGRKGFFFRDFDQNVRTTWLFRRSDFYDREIEVDLGFPAIVSCGVDATQYWSEAKAAAEQMGRPKSTLQRRALAEWITDTQHGGGALLARVIVNRVWQHHFGRGLVATPSDFGVRGDDPTHPQLLEYLARHLVEQDWSIKSIHRLILTSAVWQQASVVAAVDPSGAAIDPQNELLWKMRTQRLEAEVVRDAMLLVSGTLNRVTGGPGFKPYIPPEANLARNIKGGGYPKNARDDGTTRRRSIYMFHKRLIPYPMFQAFDRPDLMTSCAKRQDTTVAPQALVILNDRFVRSVARDFARRLVADRPMNRPLWDYVVTQAVERSFTRAPTATERDHAVAFIQSQFALRERRDSKDPQLEAIADYCQVMFGLNEFMYVD